MSRRQVNSRTVKEIAVSIVSHGHGPMVNRLIAQLRDCSEVGRIILTRNIPEPGEPPADDLVEVVRPDMPRGFGANHNAAFLHCREPYFCVLNPDIHLCGNPFPSLLACIEGTTAALAAPLIVAPNGDVEDSIRRFPTLRSLLLKAMGAGDGRYMVSREDASFRPDWVAGMFMLLRADDFAQIGGFDERYFLYYEDVDICMRLWQAERPVVACPSATAIHDARRASRKSLRHLRWHLASMGRYLWQSWRAGDARRG